MKNSTDNSKNNKTDFLSQKKHEKDSLLKEHKNLLGLHVPDGYFSTSKSKILDALPKTERKNRIFGLKPLFAYPIAASLVLLIGLSLWFQYSNNKTSSQISYFGVADSEILVNSLLVNESDIDYFMDNYIMDDILVEVALSEQKLENIFINTLFIEDSIIDEHLNEKIIENLLL